MTPPLLHPRTFTRSTRMKCPASASSENEPNSLESTIRRKHGELSTRLETLGEEGLEWRFKEAQPAQKPHALVQAMERKLHTGCGFLIVEIARSSPEETPTALAQRAANLVAHGADGIAVCTDLAYTPDGLSDLMAVCERLAGQDVPVIRLDWVLHPIQLVDTAEAGAAAANLVNGVLGKGAPTMVGFCESLMIDAPVEIVNERELLAAEEFGIRLFMINVSVGLALAIPGIREDVASSLVQNLPFGAGSIVGVRNINEARAVRSVGADAVLLKREAIVGMAEHELGNLIGEMTYMLTGDD